MRVYSYIVCLFVLLTAAPAFAQTANDPSRFSRVVTAIDSVTLQADSFRITLWGVKPVSETTVQLDALDFLDRMIGPDAVNCKAVAGTQQDIVARCTTHAGEDIGLELLNRGYVVTDRRQGVASVPAYIEAQRAARQAGKGIWKQTAILEKPPSGTLSIVQWLLGILPVVGLVMIAFVMHYRMRSLEALQQEGQENANRKETQLLSRERHVLAATLEGELADNKNRIEAFITIYGSMLQSLKSPGETPKYQQAGDIIQKHPDLSKVVFEANVSKFSLLDMKLAAQLSKLYSSLPKEQEYINIQPSEPIASVIAVVEKVLHEAEGMMPPITTAIAALDEIIGAGRKQLEG